MKEIIGMATLIAALYGGTLFAEKIHSAVREVALTKAAHGLPHISPLAAALTRGHMPISNPKRRPKTQREAHHP